MNTQQIKESIELSNKKSKAVILMIIVYIALLIVMFTYFIFNNGSRIEPTTYKQVKAEVVATSNFIRKDGDKDWYTTLTITQGNHSENVVAYFRY